MAVDAFEEYKFIVESTEKISSRRVGVSQFMFSLSAALMAAVGFLGKEIPQSSQQFTLAVCLAACGIGLSPLWFIAVYGYRKLLTWRYDMIEQVEAGLTGSFMLYTKERAATFGKEEGGKKARFVFGASGVELILPWVMFVLHGVILVATISARIAHLSSH